MTHFLNSKLKYLLLPLLLCLGVQVAHSFLHLGLIYPDEQFQTIEPANWLVTKVGWLAWEWRSGARSWLVPAFYTPVIFGFKLFGVVGGPTVIGACRLFNALLGMMTLVGLFVTLAQHRLPKWLLVASIAGAALHPGLVVWRSATLSESLCAALLWTLPLCLCKGLEAKDTRSQSRIYFALGLVAGGAVALRFQAGAWVLPSFIIWVLLFKPSRRILALSVLGAFCALVAAGLLDLLTWGRFWHSVRTNIEVNLQGFADRHGVSPWTWYFGAMAQDLGLWFFGALGLVGAAQLVPAVRARLKLTKLDAIVALPPLVFFAAHVCLGHKELRFVSPIFPVFFYLAARLIAPIVIMGDHGARFDQLLFRPRGALIMTAVLAVLTVFSYRSAGDPSRFMSYDMTEAAQAIYEDGGLRQGSDGAANCVLLVESYWVWTRGDMQQGVTTSQIAVKSNGSLSENLKANESEGSKCHYALVYRTAVKRMSQAVNQVGGWTELFRSRAGDSVFKRVSAGP